MTRRWNERKQPYTVKYKGFSQMVQRDFATESEARRWKENVGRPDAKVYRCGEELEGV